MASQGLIVGAALVAGYFATRNKAPQPAQTPSQQTTGKTEIHNAAGAVAAGSNPGEYVSPTGGAATSDGHGVILDPVFGGSTSTTPSGDTVGGDTSTTPSGGGLAIPVLGTQINATGESSPTGSSSGGFGSAVAGASGVPQPAPAPLSIDDIATLLHRTTSGLTTKQRSQAMTQEGPALGMVW